LYTLLDQRFHFARLLRLAHGAVNVKFGRLLRLGIQKFGLLGDLLAIFRSKP
jgi:hypothetical protein